MAKRHSVHPLLPGLKSEASSLAAHMAALKAQLSDLEDQKNKVDALIAVYESGAATPSPTATRSRRRTALRPGTMSLDSPYYGKALPEAAHHRLFLFGKPQTAREIWDALSGAGFPSDSKNPVHAVHWALRRRADKHKDVLLIGVGKWALRSWYNEEQIEEIVRNIGGMGGRDREVHVEKTKVAIAKLKARGVTWGRPSKLSPEGIALFLQKRAEGATWKDAAAAVGVSIPTIKYHLAKEPNPKMDETQKKSEIETSDTNVEAADTNAPTTHLRVVGQN